MARICMNCQEETVTEEKQTFLYRDIDGTKWDACMRPICDKCIEAGHYQNEDGKKRLYVGSSRHHEERKKNKSETNTFDSSIPIK